MVERNKTAVKDRWMTLQLGVPVIEAVWAAAFCPSDRHSIADLPTRRT